MSWFAKLPAAALRDQRLSDSAVRVLGVIALLAGRDHRYHSGLQRVADELGCKLRVVQHHLRALKAAGYIRVERRQIYMNGSFGPNTLVVCYPEAEPIRNPIAHGTCNEVAHGTCNRIAHGICNRIAHGICNGVAATSRPESPEGESTDRSSSLPRAPVRAATLALLGKATERASTARPRGPNRASPEVRKAAWQQRVTSYLQRTRSTDEFVRIIAGYANGEAWAVEAFERASLDMKAADAAARQRAAAP